MKSIAINGFGRIGRNVVRAYFENNLHKTSDIEIVAINDLGSPEMNGHLLKYDTTHGEFAYDVAANANALIIDGKEIALLSERDPQQLPWDQLGVDVVLECTGFFNTRDSASLHLEAGAKKVLVSAPGKEMDSTIVYGVNHQSLQASDRIVSNASCTTNCLAPIVDALHSHLVIEQGLVNTVHSYTNDQSLIDTAHSDPRRARAAAQSMIPSKTGAAAAIGLVIPELKGKLDGLAVRVPTINVSLLDLTFNVKTPCSVESVNQLFADSLAAKMNVLKVNILPLVSSDFNHNPASSIVDATQTMVNGNLVKVLAWYDNEWGFSNRMLDTATLMCELGL